ncbi:DGQHR domain-containing protein [Peteryoungia aggregata LMG 23059]|uniref:DGQHR domain-containing protein n=1 Tax=Peteryoungia aggregata LMG 23059 TaxID=1368425 RepID=A0ABU0G930_9HYPH|nr:DGQHR domain-containing protein [Peteryoungia aggregata]MDQ0421859.1 DGQHR domain-containing protein [Peteryoungia aggregata LMG 23059]
MTTPAEEDDTINVAVNDTGSNFLSPLISDPKALASEYRRRRNVSDFKSVHPADVPVEEAKGWVVQRAGKKITRLKRSKRHEELLEDRIWCLLYSMGYRTLNGSQFRIAFTRPDSSTGKKQIDVYGEDQETVLVIECKSKRERGRRSLQKDIQETISLQNYFRDSINKRFPTASKPKIIWLYATQNVLWSQSDIERADAHGIQIVTENEIQYFETFLKHMGPAGKYQILGEFLRGQKVPGLSNVKIPAIRGKIGGEIFYSFVTTPRNLLKIAFINHQALNHPDGRPAYQRMISSSRIKEIGTFIEQGGFFPTNILVNFSDSPRFDLISNSENTDENIKFGWLTLPAKYRSAWIIDGQHRLYGFSYLDNDYLDQSLFVLAFEKMAIQKEADLFITINHRQKSVPKSLLVSLLADIRMGDSDPSTALTALGSAVVRALNTDKTSPLARRFSTHGVPPEPSQNLTISEAVNGLRRSGLIGKVVGKTIAPGPLSGATDEQTVKRATTILSSYFEQVRLANPKRWEAGREAFIAVNPGIRAHLSIIAEVISYLSHKKSLDFALLKPEEFSQQITTFSQPMFDFITKASDDAIRDRFSRKFGEGGVKEYAYHLMQVLQAAHSDFGTEEFQRWVAQSNSEKIDEVNHFLMKLAERLTNYVIDTLKKIHGTHRLASDEQAFWEIGVESERIRKNAFDAQQRDKARRKPKEAYLNIVDLAEIVKQQNNWPHFEHVFKNPRPEERTGQKYYIGWINTFNELRNIAAHKNQLKTYTDEDLEFVEWLRTEVHPKVPT